ncbi:hypothetical protein C8Q73DRAFT_143348 [Cubamyces lactineus]|nr:hypothetical protein C8Q73DRAFT_143348 [Cubamyces lactineus]
MPILEIHQHELHGLYDSDRYAQASRVRIKRFRVPVQAELLHKTLILLSGQRSQTVSVQERYRSCVTVVKSHAPEHKEKSPSRLRRSRRRMGPVRPERLVFLNDTGSTEEKHSTCVKSQLQRFCRHDVATSLHSTPWYNEDPSFSGPSLYDFMQFSAMTRGRSLGVSSAAQAQSCSIVALWGFVGIFENGSYSLSISDKLLIAAVYAEEWHMGLSVSLGRPNVTSLSGSRLAAVADEGRSEKEHLRGGGE